MNKRIFVLAALALAAVACGDDDGEAAPPVIRPDGGGIVTPPLDASIDANVPQGDGSVVDTGVGPRPGAPNCFAGTPTTSVQLLNSCAEGYVEFNNLQRLPGYTGGLPSIN
jgi:hypothetical protein